MSLLIYLLQVNICITLLYAFYLLALGKETFFQCNRVYLISSVILSIIIPALQAQWFVEFFIPEEVKGIALDLSKLGLTGQIPQAQGPGELFVVEDILSNLYFAGAIISFLGFVAKLLKVKQLLSKELPGRAFSFFNQVRIDPNLPGREIIMEHEKVHAEHYHSIDIILFEAFAVVNWFNPIVYSLRKSIKNLHEFIADDITSREQGCKSDYARILVSNAFSSSPALLTNNFYNQSLLKRRIQMLNKEKSKKRALLKYGLTLPLFAALITLTSADSVLTKVSPIKTGLISDKPFSLFEEELKVGIRDTVPPPPPPAEPEVKVAPPTPPSPAKMVPPPPPPVLPKNSLYILDGKEVSLEVIEKLDPKTINDMNVLSGKNATKKYGTKGKNGVIIIKSKKD